MTPEELFEDGKAYYVRFPTSKAIPTANQAASFRGACYVWLGGWHSAKESLPVAADVFLGLNSETFLETLQTLRKAL